MLGQTGLYVSELCLGTMTFGGDEGMWGLIGDLQQRDADAMLRTALDAGINFIDTANIYSLGLSEQITGQALKNLGVPRDEVIVATKVLGPMGEGPNARGASRGHILDQAKASLKRLQLDHVDLYQIHGFDPVTPIEETMEALDQLVRQGLVRYVGRIELGGVAYRQGARHRRTAAALADPLAPGLLHPGRAGPGARDRADAAKREGRPDGLESVGGWPAFGQVQSRRRGFRRRPPGQFRLPAGGPGTRL